ncbi:MAG: HTH-type transcriptional activator IlvY [Gammaproteobacteria bacterium]|jgi:LysR family positive regulator for ilvC|nr:HTH-type transcriptional activator IlvY [Gammaproteobacteria bacterium]MDP7455426.1 HTH-type transcriptional activator IlvY [Gammaproteobacteria bacterium]|tara:strand:- start:1688 stop:2599 length:912 start_codon:yes stop_codon:yes gene_type:complete
MKNKDLYIFLQLAKSLHFSKTSHACYISPASLTRLVQRLEREAGTRLFERDNRTVNLTRAGELFRDYAVSTLASWDILKNTLQQEATSLTGSLSVFCSVTASYHYLQDLLDHYRRKYPEVEIHLHTGDSALAEQRILDEEEDVGIAALPDKLPAKMRFKVLGESPLVLIAPSSECPLQQILRQHENNPDSLPWDNIPVVLSESGLSRGRFDAWFKQKNITPNVYAQVGGNEAIVSMVSLGFGVGLVPRLVVENSPKFAKVQILDITPGIQPFVIGICALKRKLANPLIKAFWELAHEDVEKIG